MVTVIIAPDDMVSVLDVLTYQFIFNDPIRSVIVISLVKIQCSDTNNSSLVSPSRYQCHSPPSSLTLTYIKPITSYVTDAAGNKEVYQDSQLSSHISSAHSLIRGLQDHQIITMMANPQTSWFQAKYHKQQPYPDYNGTLTQENLRRDSELYFS